MKIFDLEEKFTSECLTPDSPEFESLSDIWKSQYIPSTTTLISEIKKLTSDQFIASLTPGKVFGDISWQVTAQVAAFAAGKLVGAGFALIPGIGTVGAFIGFSVGYFLTSKSCRLITKNGDSLISLIIMIASVKYSKEKWYYHPIYKMTKADNLADVYFVKLHNEARSPFRFDIFLDQSNKLSQQEKEVIIANLAQNSNALSFPGYPFGLIKVDQLSRVGKREMEPQKIQMLSEFDPNIYVPIALNIFVDEDKLKIIIFFVYFLKKI